MRMFARFSRAFWRSCEPSGSSASWPEIASNRSSSSLRLSCTNSFIVQTFIASSIRFDRDRRGLHADGLKAGVEVAASLATGTKRRSAGQPALVASNRPTAFHGRRKTARRARDGGSKKPTDGGEGRRQPTRWRPNGPAPRGRRSEPAIDRASCYRSLSAIC
jgi:hypothetical protein